MKIYIGADHNGFHHRNSLVGYLKRAGYTVIDEGDMKLDPEDDFPVFAAKTVKDVLTSDDPDARGVLICGSGQGMCMAANRYKGIRAALVYDRESAKSSRNDDDANIICIPAKLIAKEDTNVLIETFLNTPYAAAPRFNRRLAELDTLGA